jgi:Tol biopolymer transport system component
LTNHPKPEPGGAASVQAVFISYASENSDAAERIARALEAAGIEVWFDRSILRGGDAWDQKIRREIRDCALFIAVISRNTEARTEGYFRLEWHLADQRTQLMARSRPFVLPVCIDDTLEKHAEVPESFAHVHWTRLPAGEASAAFVGRVRRLLAPESHARPPGAALDTPAVAAGERLAPAASAARDGGRRGGYPRALRPVLFSACALVLLGGVLWLANARGFFWRDPLANAQISRLTDWPGIEQAAAISRDGRSVAFIADHDGRNDIWLIETDSGRYRNLTRGSVADLINPEIRTLNFSADGALVTAWSRHSDGSRSDDVNTVAVPKAGGAPRTYVAGAAEIAWSSDGRRLVYHTTAPGDPMFVTESAGRDGRRIYSAPAGVHCHFQVWSPDDTFIYFARGVPGDHWDLWRIRPDGAGLERLTFHNSLVTHPTLLDARTLLYLATDAQGSGPWLYAIDLRRRVPHRVSFGLDRYTSLMGSVDGSRLAVTVARQSAELWRVPLAAGVAVATHAEPLSADLAMGSAPRSGPGYVLYVARQAGRPGIWKLAQGSARALWVGAPSDSIGAPAIAADGRIAFTVADGGRTRLYVIGPDGAHATVVADSVPLRGNAAWAPDGKSVIVGALHDGEPRLTSFFPDGGTPQPLVYEYSVNPIWSPGGQFLLYAGAGVGTSFQLRAAAADGRAYPLPPLMLPRDSQRVVFEPDGDAIVVLRGEFRHKDFWLIDLKTGTERRLTQFADGFDIRDFDISADRSAILFQRVEESSTVALIERGGPHLPIGVPDAGEQSAH